MMNGLDVSIRLREPIAPQLVAALRQGIIELLLRPGEALSEKEIAGRFGVSRQPVREAFIKLSEAGLIEIRPSRGSFVKKISVREVANARFVREAIECSMVRHASRLVTETQLGGLQRIVEEQHAAASASDHRRFNDSDEVFHRAIAEIVPCAYAWRTVEAARMQMDRVRYLSLPDTSPIPLLISQHEEIVARLAARDADGAERAMSRHLREILIALPRIADAHPELFEDTELPAHSAGLVSGPESRAA